MRKPAVRRPEGPAECVNCRSAAGIPIAYGMPSGELIDAAENGQVALGGCVIVIGQPEYRCPACGHEWSDDEEPSPIS